MSKKAVQQFYQKLTSNEEIQEKIKVVTTWQEVIKLGEKYGYYFTQEDIDLTNADYPAKQEGLINLEKTNTFKNSICHYEFHLSTFPDYEKIDREVQRLKIKPNTVNLHLYESSFREDDCNFASVSPNSSEFQVQYDEIINSSLSEDPSIPKHEYTMRSTHLINLDYHVNHPQYEDYFTAKLRLSRLLMNLFGTDVKFSGSFWYPPKGYRLWHTNEEQPGWRMYIIDFDAPKTEFNGQSFFRYLHPTTKELVTLDDYPKLVRFFRVEKEQDELFWHCIVNNS